MVLGENQQRLMILIAQIENLTRNNKKRTNDLKIAGQVRIKDKWF